MSFFNKTYFVLLISFSIFLSLSMQGQDKADTLVSKHELYKEVLPVHSLKQFSRVGGDGFNFQGNIQSPLGSLIYPGVVCLDGLLLDNYLDLPFIFFDKIEIHDSYMPIGYSNLESQLYQLYSPEVTGNSFKLNYHGNIPYSGINSGSGYAVSSAFNYYDIQGASSFVLPDWLKTGKRPSVFLAGMIGYNRDQGPSSNPKFILDQDVYQRYIESPFVVDGSQEEADLMSSILNNINNEDFRPDDASKHSSVFGKLIFPITNSIDFQSALLYTYDKSENGYGITSVLNPYNNSDGLTKRLDAFMGFSFDLGKLAGWKSKIDVAWNYSSYNNEIMPEKHGRNFFDYAYSGAYTHSASKRYVVEHEGGNEVLHLDGIDFNKESFIPGNMNTTLAAYEKMRFDYYTQEGVSSNIMSFNGLNLNNILGDYDPGSINFEYTKQHKLRNTFQMITELVKGKHKIQLGSTVEKRMNRSYYLNSASLYTVMKSSVNRHLSILDRNTEIILPDGRIDHPRLYLGCVQTQFDKRLREKLNLAIDGTDLILVDSYNPNANTIEVYNEEDGVQTISFEGDLFELEMFAPDELYLVTEGSYGYDNYGNPISTSSPEELIEHKVNAAYSPVHISSWGEYAYTGKKIQFSAGLKIDHYNPRQYTYFTGSGLQNYHVFDDIEGLFYKINPSVYILPNVNFNANIFKGISINASYFSNTSIPDESISHSDMSMFNEGLFMRSRYLNPALKPTVNGLMKIGIEYQFKNWVDLDVYFYNRDVSQLPEKVRMQTMDGSSYANVYTFENSDEVYQAKGLGVEAELRPFSKRNLLINLNFNKNFNTPPPVIRKDQLLGGAKGFYYGNVPSLIFNGAVSYKGHDGFFKGFGVGLIGHYNQVHTLYFEGGNNQSTLSTQTIDLQISQDFSFNKGKFGFTAYLAIYNVLNKINYYQQYEKTSSPYDDGFVDSPLAQPRFDMAADPDLFKTLYIINQVQESNFDLPHVFRFGVRFKM